MMLSLLILNKVACVRVLYTRARDAESAAAAWLRAAAAAVDSLMIDGLLLMTRDD